MLDAHFFHLYLDCTVTDTMLKTFLGLYILMFDLSKSSVLLCVHTTPNIYNSGLIMYSLCFH